VQGALLAAKLALPNSATASELLSLAGTLCGGSAVLADAVRCISAAVANNGVAAAAPQRKMCVLSRYWQTLTRSFSLCSFLEEDLFGDHANVKGGAHAEAFADLMPSPSDLFDIESILDATS
jgi:hypothetical protein